MYCTFVKWKRYESRSIQKLNMQKFVSTSPKTVLFSDNFSMWWLQLVVLSPNGCKNLLIKGFAFDMLEKCRIIFKKLQLILQIISIIDKL